MPLPSALPLPLTSLLPFGKPILPHPGPHIVPNVIIGFHSIT